MIEMSGDRSPTLYIYIYIYICTYIHMTICLVFIYVWYIFIGAVSIATLLIGYYHGLLLRGIDADHLTDKMGSTGLLTCDELSLISSGHTVHHKNWLLLEHVRKFELEHLLQFCKIVKEQWVEIGSQLTAGMYIHLFIRWTIYTYVLHACMWLNLTKARFHEHNTQVHISIDFSWLF